MTAQVPGAAQVELARRLQERWDGPGFGVLEHRVLARESPGRGLAPLPDGADVPIEELVRLGSGLLADLAVEATPVPSQAGRPSRRASRLVLAPSLDRLLLDAWSARVQLGSGVRWRRFVQLRQVRDELPLRADVLARAARVGPRRVKVYVGAAADSKAAPLNGESLDLLRRVNPLLDLHVPERQRESTRANAVRLLSGGPERLLPVPTRNRDWVRGHARRIAEGLTAGGYSVVGDLDEFVAGVDAPPLRPEDVLDRLLEVVVRTVREEQS